MEAFELILIVLACEIASAILDQVVHRVSLPLIQILIGFIVAFLFPSVNDAQVGSELFLVLFIAPLLYNEARHSSRTDLWNNKWSILSLAVGLVLAIVLVIGFTLHLLVPSITLAAAFACGAALGPTDAAAVAALGQTVHLTKRQRTLLSGEALINDASGVVSFQFAIAAVTTGTFSAIDAGESFLRLFFGGIIAGIVMGFALRWLIRFLRRHGYETTSIHVIYEVLTPFVVYLAAEAINVSGILAVVAAGLVTAEPAPRLTSATETRNRLVSNSVWEVIDFLINGFLFVMLGMQLPLAFNPAITEDSTPVGELILYVLILTFLLELVRFIWTSVMELTAINPTTKQRGYKEVGPALRRAATMTVAGPKGAVTLSIIFTIPTVTGGSVFPNRDLIIFLTAGVILCTLLLADWLLPVLSPTPEDSTPAPDKLTGNEARNALLSRVIQELQSYIEKGTRPEYEPATRAVIGQYRRRIIANERKDVSSDTLNRLRLEVLQSQRDYLKDESRRDEYDPTTIARYERILARRSKALGSDVGNGVFSRIFVWMRKTWMNIRTFLKNLRRKRRNLDPDATIQMTPVQRRQSEELAAKLERVAIECLKKRRDNSEEEERKAAIILLEEHRVALASIKARQESAKERAEDAQAEQYQQQAGLTGLEAEGTEAVGVEASGAETTGAEAEGAEPTGAQVASGDASVMTSVAAGRAKGTATAAAGAGSANDTATAESTIGLASSAGPSADSVAGKNGFFSRLKKRPSNATPTAEDPRARTTRLAYASSMSRIMGMDLTASSPEQLRLLSQHLGEVEESALGIELDKINEMLAEELIDAKTAKALREDVYLLQMGLTEG